MLLKSSITLFSIGLKRLALDNAGWSRTERKSCFPMSLTSSQRKLSSSSSRDRNKMAGYGHDRSTSPRDALSFIAMRFILYYRRIRFFVCSRSHIPPCLLLSREDDDDNFRSVLLRPMLSHASPLKTDHYASNYARLFAIMLVIMSLQFFSGPLWCAKKRNFHNKLCEEPGKPKEPGIMRGTRPKKLKPLDDALGISPQS